MTPAPTASPAPAPAAGFRSAVSAEVRRLGGGFEICDRCGADFDPMESGHPYLCLRCASEGGEG